MAYISKTGITNTSTIDAEHITRIIDALDGTAATEVSASGQFDGSHSGSFSGSFIGDGANITGVTAEWDGTHNGNAQITGSLVVTNSLTASGLTVDTNALVQIGDVADDGNGTVLSIDDGNENVTISKDLRLGGDLKIENGSVTIIDFNSATGASTFAHPITASAISASGVVNASSFVGNLTGNATTATTAVTASHGVTASYIVTAQTASYSELATNATNVAITEESSNASFNIHFGSATTGFDGVNVSPQITYNPSARVLVTRNISASTDAHISSLYQDTVTYNNTETKAAAGENQGAATALAATKTLSYVTSTNAAMGVKLPTIATCVAANGEGFQKIITNTSDTACRVYPGSGDAIGGTSDNVHQNLAGHSSMILFCSGSVRWVGHKTTGISGE